MFKSNEVQLTKLLDQVEQGEIQLPDFQRGWIWDDDRIKALLVSICRGFPIGAIMTLSAEGDMKLKTRPIEGVDEASAGEADFYLLDGQQRLTSLYQALRHQGPVDTRDNRGKHEKRWYYVDMGAFVHGLGDPEDFVISVPEDKRITRNFGRDVDRDLSTSELEYSQLFFPTERLINIMALMSWSNGYNAYWQGEKTDFDANAFLGKFTNVVLRPFQDYQLPVMELDKNTPKPAVCSVFEKVNTGGVILTVFELATATFAAGAENFSLRDDWKERSHRLYSRPGGVLQGLKGDNFLQAVALLKTQEARRAAEKSGKTEGQLPGVGCRKSDILDLSLQDYHYWADRVEEGFAKAADFLVSLYVYGKNNVPYDTQIVPLAALFVELGKDLDPYNAKKKLERWYWAGVFGEAYGSAVETQFGLDLVEVSIWIRGGSPPRLVDEATFAPERLLSLRTRNSAAYKGLYALQMKNGARDWRTNSPLDAMTITTQSIDIHHVFPKAWCGRKKIPSSLYNSVINKTPIDAQTNRIISGSAPSIYLKRLGRDGPSESPRWLDDALASHWLKPAHLRKNDFAASFIARGERLLALIGAAMGRKLGSGLEVYENALKSNGVLPADGAGASDSALGQDFLDDEPEYHEFGEFAEAS